MQVLIDLRYKQTKIEDGPGQTQNMAFESNDISIRKISYLIFKILSF